MERVVVEDFDGKLRIRVNYNRIKGEIIAYAILILIPAIGAIPLVVNPESRLFFWSTAVILATCSAGGLFVWLLLCRHKQTISVVRKDGLFENMNAYGFIKVFRRYELEEILDIVEDSKRSEKAGQNYFIWMQCKSGRRIQLTPPSIYIDKDQVDMMYGALRNYVEKPLSIVQRAHFQHISVSEGEGGISLVFRPRLHFISVRYHAILIVMLSFLAFPFVLFAVLLPTEFLLMLLYPGSAIEGLVLFGFLPALIPLRRKHLAHNSNTTTLIINASLQSFDAISSVNGNKHEYTAIPFNYVKQVDIRSDCEPTFAGTVSGSTSYYVISFIIDAINSKNNRKNVDIARKNIPNLPGLIYLHETENHAEATNVKKFLENFIGNKKD